MRIELMGDFIALKDYKNELEHILPNRGIFIHNHPLKEDVLLLSDRSKKSVKDAIAIQASQVVQVGQYRPQKPSRAILWLYLSMLLDPSKNLLKTITYVEGHRLEFTTNQEYYIDAEELAEEPRHFFCANEHSHSFFMLEELPSENVRFRMTNGSTWSFFLRDANESNSIKYKGNVAPRQQIETGKTIEVSFDAQTEIYTITDI